MYKYELTFRDRDVLRDLELFYKEPVFVKFVNLLNQFINEDYLFTYYPIKDNYKLFELQDYLDQIINSLNEQINELSCGLLAFVSSLEVDKC